MTGENILPENYLLEKAATMKRFECSTLWKELKTQTDIVKKQYQKLGDTYRLDKIIKKGKPTLQNYSITIVLLFKIDLFITPGKI